MKKLIALILSFSLMFIFPTNTVIATSNKLCNCHEHEEVIGVNPVDLIDALSIESLSDCDLLYRRKEMEEDLYSVTYQCLDGNMIMYSFQYPVKYVTAEGKTNDIDIAIYPDSSGEFSFTSNKNRFSIGYPEKLTKNEEIVANNGEWRIGLSPYTDFSTEKAAVFENNDGKKTIASFIKTYLKKGHIAFIKQHILVTKKRLL
ncbi:MAG: hypothetical protein IJR89_01045 [Clostridia bacterium]|nr:hypothetical protein [Clostridia bacterium]